MSFNELLGFRKYRRRSLLLMLSDLRRPITLHDVHGADMLRAPSIMLTSLRSTLRRGIILCLNCSAIGLLQEGKVLLEGLQALLVNARQLNASLRMALLLRVEDFAERGRVVKSLVDIKGTF